MSICNNTIVLIIIIIVVVDVVDVVVVIAYLVRSPHNVTICFTALP